MPQRLGVGVRGVVEDGVDIGRSTTRPRYITTTSSAISATTPRSWVTNSTESPNSACSQQKIEDIGLGGHIERRGRLVGDQQLGRQASAKAMQTRWRMPPENWKA